MAKDYYKILGVQEDADELVIRASYLALLKRYNLDDWKGDKQQAIKMLANINEAYSVLKDRYERVEYNARKVERLEAAAKPIEITMSLEEIEAAWCVACNYYGDLEPLYANLFQISEQAANNFKLLILSSKDYSNRNKLAAKLELDYLKSRFGADQDLINFGRELILEGLSEAATELEQVFHVLGSAVNSDEVINKISEKYQTRRYMEHMRLEKLREQRDSYERQEQERKQEILKKQENEEAELARRVINFFIWGLVIFIGGTIYFFNKPAVSSSNTNSVSEHKISRVDEIPASKADNALSSAPAGVTSETSDVRSIEAPQASFNEMRRKTTINVSDVRYKLNDSIWNSKEPNSEYTCGDRLSSFGNLQKIYPRMGMFVVLYDDGKLFCDIDSIWGSKPYLSKHKKSCENGSAICLLIADDSEIYTMAIEELELNFQKKKSFFRLFN